MQRHRSLLLLSIMILFGLNRACDRQIALRSSPAAGICTVSTATKAAGTVWVAIRHVVTSSVRKTPLSCSRQ